MNRSRLAAAGLGLLMVLISVWQLENASSGLVITRVQDVDLPVTLISPEGDEGVNRPLVLIGHGAAGSQVIMRGYALTLAHAGYNVALWDFAGHGGNPQPLPVDRDAGLLVSDAEAALRIAAENGLPVDRTGILGHSMGSGVALTYSLLHPETMATIAVSPVDRPVTEELPRNLLLVAGEYEASFIHNAAKLLLDAGGPGGDPQAGTARGIEIIPDVEHITILFSSTAHAAARSWLDNIFGSQPGAVDYTDRRMFWYLVGLAGTLLFFWSIAPMVDNLNDRIIETVDYSIWRRIGALILGALGATGILYVLSQAGLDLTDLLEILVGGYLLVWFAIAGALSIVLLGRMPGQMVRAALLGGLMVFAALWIGVGWLGSYVWIPVMLIPDRLVFWPLGVILSLPWLLAVAQAVLPTSRLGRVVWWLGYSLVLIGGLLLALRLNPELSFLMLILPVFPVILALHALAAGPYRWRTAFALGGALFIGWLVLAVFPLQ